MTKMKRLLHFVKYALQNSLRGMLAPRHPNDINFQNKLPNLRATVDPSAIVNRWDTTDELIARGNELKKTGLLDGALECYGRAIAQSPNNVTAFNCRGIVLHALERYDEALDTLDEGLMIDPHSHLLLANRGTVLEELRRYEDALDSYDRAIATKSDFAGAHFNASMCRLRLGHFDPGWTQYEWRWKSEGFPSKRKNYAKPIWLGQDGIAGKTILLYAEQGFGDTIQFCRYANELALLGATVLLGVPSQLKSLLSELRGVSGVLSHGEPLPKFDFHCPMMSLPLAFKTRLETIPASIPYLHPTTSAVKAWQDRLEHKESLLVGIVWSGDPRHKRDRQRSIPLNRLMTLNIPGVSLVSVQNEVRPEDMKVLKAHGDVHHFGLNLKEFSDTAALISLMDAVIAVDTSVAHLAGALGKPVWILLSAHADWRWLENREDSPWYPTARLFRQERPGDWDGVIARVKQSLLNLCSSRSH